jgi:WD40 repeat protein
MLAIGSALNDILIYSLIKGDLLYRLPGHTHRIKSLAVEGRMLFSGSSDGTIRVWNISDIDNVTIIISLLPYTISIINSQ